MNSMHPTRSTLTWILMLIMLLSAAWLAWSQWQRLETVSNRAAITRIHVSLAPGQGTYLGASELASPHADSGHVHIHRDSAGAWMLENNSADKAVEFKQDGQWLRLQSWPLAIGDEIQIGETRWTVNPGTTRSTLQLGLDDGRKAEFDGARLLIDGGRPVTCPEQKRTEQIREGLRRFWNATTFFEALEVGTPLWLGGLASCGMQLDHSAIPTHSARIEQKKGVFYLAPNKVSAREILVKPRNAPTLTLASRTLSLTDVTGLIIGRTVYQIETSPTNSHTLQLNILSRGGWKTGSGTDAPASNASVRQESLSLHTDRWPANWPPPWTVVLLIAFFIGALALVLKGRNPRKPTAWAVHLAVSAIILVALPATWLARGMVGETWLLTGLVLTILIALHESMTKPERSPILLMLVSLITLAGLWVQLELALVAPDTGALHSWRESLMLATAFFGLHVCVSGWASRLRQEITHGRFLLPMLVKVLAGLALVMLAIQAIYGSEGGVWGLQPVELGKLALLVLVALVTAQAGEHYRLSIALLINAAAVVIVFLALLATALLLVHDYSPLILMAFMFTLTAIAIGWSARSWAGSALTFALLAGALWLGAYALAFGVDLIQAHDLNADRFAVWADGPLLHPHTGGQLLRAQALMSAGLQGVPAAWSVPAVQDDFVLAFVHARFGLVGVAFTLMLQIGLLCALIRVAHRQLTDVTYARTRDERVLSRFLFVCSCAGAGFLLGHVVLTYGVAYGYLPVIGQPLWGISAGNSIRLLFVLPLLLLADRALLPPAKQPSHGNS